MEKANYYFLFCYNGFEKTRYLETFHKTHLENNGKGQINN